MIQAAVERAPRIGLTALDDLWFQLAGTLCNLTCTHCFISCSPTNHSFALMVLDDVLSALEESKRFGVKEYYFTGGEPFLHPSILRILEATLAIGPATVLTNGTLFKPEGVARLARMEASSLYSLELRVSIDGYSEETNDPIRGRGSFRRAMNGVRLLLEHGFLPIVTVAQTWPDGEDDPYFERFVETLRREGYSRPRVKIIPTLRIGAEAKRTRGYHSEERVTEAMMEGYDASQLLCSHARMVTARGVYVCPILIDSPEARLGSRLAEAVDPFPIAQGACYTCYLGGAICSNVGAGGRDAG